MSAVQWKTLKAQYDSYATVIWYCRIIPICQKVLKQYSKRRECIPGEHTEVTPNTKGIWKVYSHVFFVELQKQETWRVHDNEFPERDTYPYEVINQFLRGWLVWIGEKLDTKILNVPKSKQDKPAKPNWLKRHLTFFNTFALGRKW